MPGRQVRMVGCTFCPKEISYRADRMFSHLGYRGAAAGRTDVATCRLMPARVRRLFENCNGLVPERPDDLLEAPNDRTRERDDGDEEDPVLSRTQSVNTTADDVGDPMQLPRNAALVDRPPRDLRQLSLVEGFNASTKQVLDKAWAAAFYEANIAFNIVRHPAFIHAVRETARHRMPAYAPPSYHSLCTSLLQSRKDDVERDVQEKIGTSVQKYGVTLCCDGWDNVQNRPLLNIIQCSPKGDHFLGSVDTTGETKDHVYVANVFRPFVDKVGPLNVVQLCTDNAPVMVLASQEVMRAWPHLYIQGCAAHCLDLLLEDWGKAEWVKTLVRKVRTICVFVKSHHASQAIFRSLSPNHAIRLPTETRFATSFIMIDRIVQVRNALERMIVHEDWHALMGDLRRRNLASYEKAFAVRRFVRSDGFWHACKNFLYMVIPVVKALRVFDGKGPAMGLAWKVMYDLQTHVRGFRRAPFNMSADLADVALDQFRDRWDLMRTELHWVGGLLNPGLRGWLPLHEHEQARRILNRVLQKLTPDEETYARVLNQYQDFLENRGPFAGSIDPVLHGGPPHEWWDAMGGEAKALQTIARRVLAQVCSVSACERNWSMYSYVHSKVRNRLKPSRAEDLVYIYTNSRLLRHKSGPRPAKWYDVNEIHSDDESDGEDGDDGNGPRADIDDGNGQPGNDEVEHRPGEEFDPSFHSDDDNDDHDDDDGHGRDDDGHGLHDDGHDVHDDIQPTESLEREGCQHRGLGLQSRSPERATTDNANDGLQCQAPNDPSSSRSAPGRELPELGVGQAPSSTEGDLQPLACTEVLPSMSTRVEALTFVHIDALVPAVDLTLPRAVRSTPQGTTVDRTLPRVVRSTPQGGVVHTPPSRALRSTSQAAAVYPRTRSTTMVQNVETALNNSMGTPVPRPPPRIALRRRAASNMASTSTSAPTDIHAGSSSGFQVPTSIQSTVEGRATNHPPIEVGSSSQAEGSRVSRSEVQRGTKRRRRARYQGRALPFRGEEDDTRPQLDDDGIRDVEGSRPTKKIVTRDENLRLRSVTPHSDEEFSTEDSDGDSRVEALDDPTVVCRI